MRTPRFRDVGSLYLCYQSVLEPLTQTQVVAYLEGLAAAGFQMVLLTFEPRALTPAEAAGSRDQLAAKGIAWYWLRYHKRPTAPATAWDVATGIACGLRLVRRHRLTIVHARGHVPGVMALALKRLTGARFLFDIRGYMAEEYVDAGTWPRDGVLYRVTKGAERALVAGADGYVVLTQGALAMLREWYPTECSGKPVGLIPTCVDFRRIDAPSDPTHDTSDPAIVYVGKLGGWYMSDEMSDFVATAAEAIPRLQWHVWTQSDPEPLRRALGEHGIGGMTTIGSVPPEALGSVLSQASGALSFIRPTPSKRASSPTKVGEYLAAGLPVVSNSGIGDVDQLLAGGEMSGGHPVGVVVRQFDRASYRAAAEELRVLMKDPGTAGRCRAVARAELDLEEIGWLRYRRLYDALGG